MNLRFLKQIFKDVQHPKVLGHSSETFHKILNNNQIALRYALTTLKSLQETRSQIEKQRLLSYHFVIIENFSNGRPAVFVCFK